MPKTELQHSQGANMLSIEERTMVRDLILLPLIDTMVQRSLSEIERSGNVLRRLYLMAGQYIQRRITQDTYQLQRELKRRDIKIISEEQTDFISYYDLYCRGYRERFGMTRDVMRSEISLRLTRYIGELNERLK